MGWLQRLFLGDIESDLKRTKENFEQCAASLGRTISARNTLAERVSLLEVDNNAMNARLETINPTKIPEATIEYRKMLVKPPNEILFTKIDIRNFIQQYDTKIYDEIKRLALFHSPTRDLDKLIPELYKLAKKDYRYVFDQQYGLSDVWLFPYELRKVGSGDCEDWAHMIGTHFAIAGVPSDRWFISIGEARAGYGHSTVYARDSTNTWRHLASTKPDYRFTNLRQFPSKDDQDDITGLKPNVIWWSFNDKLSIHKFETPKARTTFETALGSSIAIKRR